jgi:hypothetical protein
LEIIISTKINLVLGIRQQAAHRLGTNERAGDLNKEQIIPSPVLLYISTHHAWFSF